MDVLLRQFLPVCTCSLKLGPSVAQCWASNQSGCVGVLAYAVVCAGNPWVTTKVNSLWCCPCVKANVAVDTRQEMPGSNSTCLV